VIAGLEIFSRLTPRQHRRLAQLFIPRRYSQGELVIRQGDVGLGMFIITSGQMEVYQELGGTTRQIAILGAGQTVGEMALLDDQPRSANVRVLEDCDCLLLTRDGFQGLARQVPEFIWGIIPFIVSRLRQVIDSSELMSANPQAAAQGPPVSSSPVPPVASSPDVLLPPSDSETVMMMGRQEARTQPVSGLTSTPAETTGEISADGLFASLFQLTSASFMLGSALLIYGLGESSRWVMGEGSVRQQFNRNERMVSAVAETVEENMSEDGKNILGALRSLLDAFLSLFG
jgi:CRP-like cAMP-binding protein